MVLELRFDCLQLWFDLYDLATNSGAGVSFATKAQREDRQAHRTVSMRRLYLILGSSLLVLLILAVSGGAEAMASKLLLYVRVAQLYTKDPPDKIAMPLENVPKKQVANTWHALRGRNRLHEGQDIFAPRGTPIFSATEGYVYSVGENPLGGQTVSVIGDGGRVYYYAHLDSYARELAEGDHVTTRTMLGYVGTTGNAQRTPPHLHFGVYTTAGAINPLPLLIDRSEPKTVKDKTPNHKPRNGNREDSHSVR